MSPTSPSAWNISSVETGLAGLEPPESEAAARSREVAGKIAHSFSNLLTVILGSAELAQREDGLPPRLRQHLSRILDASLEASVLCEELLAHFPPPRPR